jgi:hypothetical protein
VANLDTHETGLKLVRRRVRQAGHVHHAQVMLVAAGLASFGIVAVAAAMMTTLF